MTVAHPSDEYELDTGLEDFDSSDAVVPRIKIVGKEGLFEDSLTGETSDVLRGVVLGLVKQRSLWHEKYDDGDFPMCKSPDFVTGFPNVSDEQPAKKRFPWALAKMEPKEPGPDGLIRLSCEVCPLKEWGSHPDGNKPYCAEQFVMPMLYTFDPEGHDFVPGIVSFQKTGLKPVKAYLTGFSRSQTPPYTALTEIRLDVNTRGQTVWSTPKFRRVGDTDQEEWRSFSSTYRQIRGFLQQAPRTDEEDAPAPASNNVNSGPPPEMAKEPEPPSPEPTPPPSEAKSEPPKAAPAPASSEDDDDLPF